MKNFLLTITLLFSTSIWAGESDVIEVSVRHSGSNTFSFDVTIRHNDEGWEHYVNKWEVLSPDGKVLGARKLWHPHVDEQPFTRGLSGVKIPANITHVIIRSHDLVHQYGGKTITVKLTR